MTRFIINLVLAVVVVLPMLTIANQPHLLSLEVFDDAERIAYDYRITSSIPPNPALDDRIAIVNIDQESLDQIGNWPWRRDKMGDFIAQLKDVYKVRMIVVTDSFSSRDDLTSGILDDLRDRFYYDDAVQVAIDQIEPEFNYDLRLLNEIDGRPVVLGFEFDESKRQFGQLPGFVDFVDLQDAASYSRDQLRPLTGGWLSYEGYIANDADFLERSLGAGFRNFAIDSDGSIRRYQHLANYAGQQFLSIPITALRHYNDPSQPDDASIATQKDYSLLFGDTISRIGVQGMSADIDRSGMMLLNFQSRGGIGGGQFDYISAYEVIDGAVSVARLRDKVVFIGSTSEVLNDLWRTPVNPRMPGVEIHAMALQNLLDSNALVRSHNAWLVEGALLLLLGLLMSWLYPKMRVALMVAVTIAAVLLTLYLNISFFWRENNEVYRIVPFLVLFVVIMVSTFVSGFVVEYRQKKKVEGVLNQYIPPELAKEVNASGKGFSMEGEIREMTILFSDVRDFTSISENLKPHDLTSLMNQMLTALSRQIHINRGTIDKYIGDAVMAFWNAPLDDPKHALNAVNGAVAMQHAMAKLSAELVTKGLPELNMGIGINTGESCVGNMGSEIRLSYTVMGDAVNLASRLEGLTKQYGIGIIVGERTYELTKDDYLYRPVDSVRVKGKNEAVHIYEPIADRRYAKPDMYELQDESHRYWHSYQERRFDEMVAILQELLKKYPGDALMQQHLKQAVYYQEAPPPDDWDAVTTYETK